MSNTPSPVTMNIYLIGRYDNVGYDAYDAFVVVATNETEATLFLLKEHPTGNYSSYYSPWSDKTTATLIGTTDIYTEPTEILGSYNAG